MKKNSEKALIKNNTYTYNVILRQTKNSKDYINVKKCIQININNYDIFKKNEFIYKSQIIDTKYNLVRDNLIEIIDINIDFLNNIDYNEIKKGEYNLEKILYIFVCNNEEILDKVYRGDKLMKKIKEEFDVLENELNKMLYYNYEDVYGIKSGEEIDKLETKAFNKGKEQGINKGLEEGRLEIRKAVVINMLENNFDDETILKITNIDYGELELYKKEINK